MKKQSRRRKQTSAQRKRIKKAYDALRYAKKKLTKLIEEIEKNYKNIYGNKEANKLGNYTKKDIEELYKKAVFDKDKYAKKKLKDLADEYKGGEKQFKRNWADVLQDDLQKNIYGTRPSKLRKATRDDLQNFKTLMNNLTPDQKLDFLNNSSYYGARRYQKPPAESLTFNLQVENDGASYIVQDLIKYYNDNGIPLPNNLIII